MRAMPRSKREKSRAIVNRRYSNVRYYNVGTMRRLTARGGERWLVTVCAIGGGVALFSAESADADARVLALENVGL